MIDEVLKYIIENTKGKSIDNNTVRSKDLRNQAFERLNIKIDKDMDKRIKALVGALNTLSDKILEMRNSQGDAHAQGSRRIVINEEEAILTANSAMILCEYLFRKYEKRKGSVMQRELIFISSFSIFSIFANSFIRILVCSITNSTSRSVNV